MHDISVLKPERLSGRADDPLPLAGPSPEATSARAAFERALTRRGPVLIACEPGCRPATIAEALHVRTRGTTPLIALDCSVSDPLEIERRLFGAPGRVNASHDIESVTAGAALVAVEGGTLFLDNIEDLPASSQRRLARVLRDGEVCAETGATPMPVAFRLVGSSTCDLEIEVRDGRFRGDLLRRFTTCRIAVPPLRQRAADLPVVIGRLIDEMHASPRAFTQPALTVLKALPWSTNIDELAELLSRIVHSPGAPSSDVRQEDVLMHLPIGGTLARMDLTVSLREARHRFEREYIAAVLERHQWRMSDAARTLGIERANLYRKARQLGITRSRNGE